MPLTAEERQEVYEQHEREFSRLRPRQECSLTKHQLRAALDAIDGALDGILPTINAAIPEPQRSTLTQGQKMRLLRLIVHKRWGVD